MRYRPTTSCRCRPAWTPRWWHGRLVNLGGSAGGSAAFDPATLRSRSLRIPGYTNTELTRQQRATAVRTVADHAAAGRLVLDCDTVPLDGVGAAWGRQADGRADRRIVPTP